MISFFRMAAVAGGLAFAGLVHAADDNQVIYPGAARSGESAAKSAGATLNSFSLVIGVGLAAAGAWLFWRNRRTAPSSRELRALAIDETRSLGNRQYLVVASYEGKKFLLGVCPGRIDMLTSLGAAAAIAAKARE